MFFHIFLIFVVNPYHSITHHFISLSTVGYLWNQLFHFNRITPNTASPKYCCSFGGAQFAINEDDRHFLYLEATFVGGEFHFYLEGVSFEADTVQIDGLQYPAAVTYKSGCSVVDGQPGDEAHILGGK